MKYIFIISLFGILEMILFFFYIKLVKLKIVFFSDYAVQLKHSQRIHTHPYERTHANPTLMSIFEDWAVKSSRLTKSPHAPRCQRERRLH